MNASPMNHLVSLLNAHRKSWRAVATIAILVVMATSGLVFTGSPVSASGLAAPAHGSMTAASSAPLLTGTQLQNSPFETSPGTGVAATNNTTVLGPTPSAQPVQFTVGFQLRNEAQLAQILDEQETTGSPMFHHWLTLGQEQAEFGADPTVMQDTINYFTSLGFHVLTQGLLSVSFQGSAAQTNVAFRTDLVQVHFENGSISTMNNAPLSLPSAIAPYVQTVNGIDTSHQIQVQHFLNPLFEPIGGSSSSSGATPSAAMPLSPPGANDVNITALYNFTNHAFGFIYWYSFNAQSPERLQVITPGALSYLYDANPLVNAGYNGGGNGHPITIAIVMAGGINPDDLREYGQMVWNNPNNILNRLSVMPVDGSYKLNGTLYYTDGASSEMALDIEYSSTMAPGAHILAVYGPGLFTTTIDDDYAAIAGMATVPNIVSNSWGGDEDGFGSGSLYGTQWDNPYTMHSYVMLITARGATVIASSGDGGGFDPGTGMLAGSYPATDPYILAVNGIRTAVAGADGNPYPNDPTIGWTNLSIVPGTDRGANYETRVSTATQILYQSYWYVPFSNYTLQRAPPSASGGFGTSDWFNQSWYQHGPFMPNLGRSLGSGVAAEADFNQSIFFDGEWHFEYGGTSFACPTTAGMLAIIDDYMQQHGFGAYLGNGNPVTTLVGNAYFNGNLTLVPYYDVGVREPGGMDNGTSYWGNQGVSHGWSWPPGQLFPMNTYGPVYGNTTRGWDFPTGWGSINAANFAYDLAYLYGLPGKFTTLSSNGLAWNPSGWGNLALNDTYTFHVNASAALQALNPHVTIVFTDSSGTTTSFQPTPLTAVSLGPGYDFQIDTSQAPFDSPGYVYFEFGDSANATLGWAYSWIAQDISASGQLSVQVVAPSTSSFPGGATIYNAWMGWYQDIGSFPDGVAQPYTNTFTVLVEDNGVPVYNAVVTATIPSIYDIAWEDSIGANRTGYGGTTGSGYALTEISYSFSNRSGDALVHTVNVVKPVPIHITATYGPLTANTSYSLSPLPNVKAQDNYGGLYSQFNFINYLTWYFHQTSGPYTPSCSLENAYAINGCNQSGYYSVLYGWQGEEMPVSVNDYTGAPMANMNVWLGNWDVLGHVTQFHTFEPTGGIFGITNTSGTSNITNSNGDTTIYIPNNQTPPIGYEFGGGVYAGDYVGVDFLAVSDHGLQNRTFGYSEPCAGPNPLHPTPLTTCVYNNSFERNYTAVPVFVFPDPVSVTTQTRQGADRDFFTSGANISWQVKVSLPDNDPFLGGTGTNWNPGLEHVVSVLAYVDGIPAGNLSPTVPPDWQFWHVTGNLTGNYIPGIHVLTIVVTDSLGRTFTQRHIFIVGSVAFTNVNPTSSANVYSLMPFNLNWTIPHFPADQVSNKTFNMSLEIRYVTSGCGGLFLCPQVVNFSIPVHPDQLTFGQNINRTLLTKSGFYTGAGDLPPGQYQLIVWLNANHSGATSAEFNTYLVFDPLQVQINGPAANAVVPAGNLTISYAYSGLYITDAVLSVYQSGVTAPVYQIGAFIPGIGGRGGSDTWTSVQTGAYAIVLNLTTPYQNISTREVINVTSSSPFVWINTTKGQSPVAGLPSVMTATILALVAAIIGLILGLLLATPLRPGGRRPGAVGAPEKPSPKPWEEPASSSKGPPSSGAASANDCAICHEKFETPYALAQHAKITHGIEE